MEEKEKEMITLAIIVGIACYLYTGYELIKKAALWYDGEESAPVLCVLLFPLVLFLLFFMVLGTRRIVLVPKVQKTKKQKQELEEE